jgi:hypothetical protein
MYTTMIHDPKLEDRTQNTITLLVVDRGLDPKYVADYLIMVEGYTRESADRAVSLWLYSDNT